MSDRSRNNNFNMIRLIAALFVFAGHMGPIMGGAPPTVAGFSLHELGVSILFLTGGYLIAGSWERDRSFVRYLVRRVFRLWMPFAAMILLAAFAAGPFLSDLGVNGYFSAGVGNFLKNLRFFIVYALPGVFPDNPIAGVVNGSLWTMPVEFGLYLVTPAVLEIVRAGRGKRFSFPALAVLSGALTAVYLILSAIRGGKPIVFYGTDVIAALHLAVFYVIGMLFAEDTRGVLRKPQTGMLLFAVLAASQFWPQPFPMLLLYITLPVLVFSFALPETPAFAEFGSHWELSYGIYLYGFFFQQLTVHLMVRCGYAWNYFACFFISLGPTLLMSWLSCLVIENPMKKAAGIVTKRLR